MKKFALLSLVLGAIFLAPTGAFAKDKHHHHKHHKDYDRRDWSYRDYRGNDRDYWDNLRQLQQDRLNHGYNADGTPAGQYYRRNWR